MSRGIRKSIRRRHVDDRYAKRYFFRTQWDGIIATSIPEARDLLCEFLHKKPFLELPKGLQEEMLDWDWRQDEGKELVSFPSSKLPGWEPENDDEEENPPILNYTAESAIEIFGFGVVYVET